MFRSSWISALVIVAAGAVTASGQQSSPNYQSVNGNVFVTIEEPGKPKQRCKLIGCWTMEDGTRTCQVQALDTGEIITIEDMASVARSPYLGNHTPSAKMTRIYRWGDCNFGPTGCRQSQSCVVSGCEQCDSCATCVQPQPHATHRVLPEPVTSAINPSRFFENLRTVFLGQRPVPPSAHNTKIYYRQRRMPGTTANPIVVQRNPQPATPYAPVVRTQPQSSPGVWNNIRSTIAGRTPIGAKQPAYTKTVPNNVAQSYPSRPRHTVGRTPIAAKQPPYTKTVQNNAAQSYPSRPRQAVNYHPIQTNSHQPSVFDRPKKNSVLPGQRYSAPPQTKKPAVQTARRGPLSWLMPRLGLWNSPVLSANHSKTPRDRQMTHANGGRPGMQTVQQNRTKGNHPQSKLGTKPHITDRKQVKNEFPKARQQRNGWLFPRLGFGIGNATRNSNPKFKTKENSEKKRAQTVKKQRQIWTSPQLKIGDTPATADSKTRKSLSKPQQWQSGRNNVQTVQKTPRFKNQPLPRLRKWPSAHNVGPANGGKTTGSTQVASNNPPRLSIPNYKTTKVYAGSNRQPQRQKQVADLGQAKPETTTSKYAAVDVGKEKRSKKSPDLPRSRTEQSKNPDPLGDPAKFISLPPLPASKTVTSDKADPLLNPKQLIADQLREKYPLVQTGGAKVIPSPSGGVKQVSAVGQQIGLPPGTRSVVAASGGVRTPMKYLPVPIMTMPTPNHPPGPPPPNMPSPPPANHYVNGFSPRNPPAQQQQSGYPHQGSMMPGYGGHPQMMGYGQPMMPVMYNPQYPYAMQQRMGYPMPAYPYYGQNRMPMNQSMGSPSRPMNSARTYQGPMPPSPNTNQHIQRVGHWRQPYYGQQMPVQYANPAMDRPGVPLTTPNYYNPGVIQQMLTTLKVALSPSQREWAVLHLAQYQWQNNPHIVQGLLVAAKEDPAASVRAASVRALMRMNVHPNIAGPTLQSMRTDTDASVRQAVQSALTQWGSNAASPNKKVVVPVSHKKTTSAPRKRTAPTAPAVKKLPEKVQPNNVPASTKAQDSTGTTGTEGQLPAVPPSAQTNANSTEQSGHLPPPPSPRGFE